MYVVRYAPRVRDNLTSSRTHCAIWADCGWADGMFFLSFLSIAPFSQSSLLSRCDTKHLAVLSVIDYRCGLSSGVMSACATVYENRANRAL